MCKQPRFIKKMRGLTGLIVCLMVGTSCSSDSVSSGESAPWHVSDDVEQEPLMTPEQMTPEVVRQPVELKTCTDPFYFGPIWKQVNQAQAVEESEWIVQLETTKRLLFTEESYNEETYTYEVDYEAQSQELHAQLQQHRLHIIENKPLDESDPEGTRDMFLVVKGKPQDVISLMETSCHIRGFDLTGFHCDCAPQMCAQAESCKLVYMDIGDRPNRDAPLFSRSALSCRDDVFFGLNYASMRIIDLRGVTWAFGTNYSFVTSWDESPCQAQRQAGPPSY